jgi:hypothetical protein
VTFRPYRRGIGRYARVSDDFRIEVYDSGNHLSVKVDGLRGMYLPDNAYVIAARTRRDLKSALAWEGDSVRDAGLVGASKRAIAWLAAEAWRNRGKATLDLVAPYRRPDQSHYPYGIFCSAATREEFDAYIAEND